MSLLLSSSSATAAKGAHLRLYSHRRYHHRPQPQSFLQLSSAAASSSARVSIREMTETETQMSKSHLSAGERGCWWRRGAAGGGGAAEGGGPGGGRGRSGRQSPCWAGPAQVGRASARARARAVGRHWQTRVRPNAYPDPGRVWPGFCPGFSGPGWARAGCWPDPAHLTSLRNNCMLGMASGQLNRLESLRIAFRKAGEEAKGAALASDAFPFAWKDAVEEACQTGSGVIVEPGRREYQTQRRRIAATSMGSLSSSRMRDTSGTERISLLSHF